MAITPEIIQGSLVLMVIIYVLAFAFQVYVLYLNWKQSKVNDQMTELLSEVKAIRKQLDKFSSKKK